MPTVRATLRRGGSPPPGLEHGPRDLVDLVVGERPRIEQEAAVSDDSDDGRLAHAQLVREPLLDGARGARQLGERLVEHAEHGDLAAGGGGALPLTELPSFACAVEEELAAALRSHEPPVIAVVRDGRTLLDCRTLTDAEADEVAAAVHACR